jgi:hypothetical protein
MLRKSAISMGDATTKSARFRLKVQCIKVSPGERMRLRVDGINGVFAAHHRGGLCHLQLRLQTGWCDYRLKEVRAMTERLLLSHDAPTCQSSAEDDWHGGLQCLRGRCESRCIMETRQTRRMDY